jgi:hypothetical protein
MAKIIRLDNRDIAIDLKPAGLILGVLGAGLVGESLSRGRISPAGLSIGLVAIPVVLLLYPLPGVTERVRVARMLVIKRYLVSLAISIGVIVELSTIISFAGFGMPTAAAIAAFLCGSSVAFIEPAAVTKMKSQHDVDIIHGDLFIVLILPILIAITYMSIFGPSIVHGESSPGTLLISVFHVVLLAFIFPDYTTEIPPNDLTAVQAYIVVLVVTTVIFIWSYTVHGRPQRLVVGILGSSVIIYVLLASLAILSIKRADHDS